jgi:hypothetical protein
MANVVLRFDDRQMATQLGIAKEDMFQHQLPTLHGNGYPDQDICVAIWKHMKAIKRAEPTEAVKQAAVAELMNCIRERVIAYSKLNKCLGIVSALELELFGHE